MKCEIWKIGFEQYERFDWWIIFFCLTINDFLLEAK